MSELFNYIDAPLEQLNRRGKELTAAINGNYLNPERKAQVQHEISCIALELWCRHRDNEVEFVEVDKMV